MSHFSRIFSTPPNYTFLSFPRTYSDISALSSGGGTGFLIREPFTQLHVSLPDFSSFESSNVTLKLPHTKLSVTFTVSHIHTVTEPSTHCQSQQFGILPTSLQSKVILALVVNANEIFNHAVQVNWSCRMCHKNELVIQPRLESLACCASKPRFQPTQHAERSLAFNTCDRAGQVESRAHSCGTFCKTS